MRIAGIDGRSALPRPPYWPQAYGWRLRFVALRAPLWRTRAIRCWSRKAREFISSIALRATAVTWKDNRIGDLVGPMGACPHHPTTLRATPGITPTGFFSKSSWMESRSMHPQDTKAICWPTVQRGAFRAGRLRGPRLYQVSLAAGHPSTPRTT